MVPEGLRLHYLSGVWVPGIPFMASYGGQGNKVPLADVVWAADNGCFARPATYTNVGYLRWLDARPRNALFAAAPDVVGDWRGTLKRSKPMLLRIRLLGFKAALVLQDGAYTASIPWDELDAVFVGGSTKFKLSPVARGCVRAARERGKWAHMGRVNSWKRIKVAHSFGCQSVDGNILAFGRDVNLRYVREWMRRIEDGELDVC